jgi:hypothetical protein
MESYIVKFWKKKEDGYREQLTETVQAKGKNNHKTIKNIIQKKYQLEKEDIVSITYV